MNFLKNSIFNRNSGEDVPDLEPENENQMLAVWGSPGSGKTLTAVKLAVRLAMQKRDVALLLCDMNTPMLPCICPPAELPLCFGLSFRSPELRSWRMGIQLSRSIERICPLKW